LLFLLINLIFAYLLRYKCWISFWYLYINRMIWKFLLLI